MPRGGDNDKTDNLTLTPPPLAMTIKSDMRLPRGGDNDKTDNLTLTPSPLAMTIKSDRYQLGTAFNEPKQSQRNKFLVFLGNGEWGIEKRMFLQI
ncbi:MAG: hypothetical protein F6K35_32650 [Okeania sp. SIO2H7]|nr:hypothetical protein [Okeania sp. SIO2H7]